MTSRSISYAGLSQILVYSHQPIQIIPRFMAFLGVLGIIHEIYGMASSSDLETHKACKFARQYTEEQVKHILKGKFVLSWFELAQSLTVAPQNLITAYQASSSPGEFHNAIIKLKPPDPRKGTVISRAVSDRSQVAEDNSDGLEDGENLFDVHNDHPPSPGNGISSPLEAEISDLRATLTERDGEIAKLQSLLEKKTQELSVRDEAINSLRRFLGKIRLNLERKTDHVTLFEMVSGEEWVYEKKFGYRKVGNLGAELAG